MKHQEEELQSGLYMVATPVGNLEDLSARALRILSKVDWIAAEDTRETKKLLHAFNIHTQLISLHEFSSEQKIQKLVEKLSHGEKGAYVSDAGTPGICDPGADLVKMASEKNIKVIPVPGASAPVILLSASGFAASAFTFHGFFPREKSERESWLKRAVHIGGLQVFFESPHRVRESMEFLAGKYSQCQVVMGRELTKRFETITRGTLASALELLQKEEPRGEYVIALELPSQDSEATNKITSQELLEHLTQLAELGANQKILTQAAIAHGFSKNEAYDLALKALKK